MTAQQVIEYKAKRDKILSLLKELFPNNNYTSLTKIIKKKFKDYGIKDERVYDEGSRWLSNNIYLNNKLIANINRDPNPNAVRIHICNVDILLLNLYIKVKNNFIEINVEPEL